MTGESWALDRLSEQYGDRYDLIATAGGVAAVPRETGRETLKAHSALVLDVLLAQAAANAGRAEPLARCRRAHDRVQRAHAAREARRG